jgi:hypothetical protein
MTRPHSSFFVRARLWLGCLGFGTLLWTARAADCTSALVELAALERYAESYYLLTSSVGSELSYDRSARHATFLNHAQRLLVTWSELPNAVPAARISRALDAAGISLNPVYLSPNGAQSLARLLALRTRRSGYAWVQSVPQSVWAPSRDRLPPADFLRTGSLNRLVNDYVRRLRALEEALIHEGLGEGDFDIWLGPEGEILLPNPSQLRPLSATVTELPSIARVVQRLTSRASGR